MTAQELHIAIATDRNYLPHAATLMRSICENNQRHNLRFHILTMDSRLEQDEKLNQFFLELRGDRVSFEVLFVDENHPLIRAIPSGCVIQSRSAFLRFFAPELINVEKLLYLDCDMIVLDDLAPLFDINLGDKTLGVVSDLFGSARAYAKGFGLHYFNSGMVLFNIPKWKAEHCLEQSLKFIQGPFSRLFSGKKHAGDQDVLNMLFQGQVVYVHPKYNAVNPLFLRRPDFRGDVFKEAHDKPVIVHFAGGAKPWNAADFHPLTQEYWKYRQMTPWKNADDATNKNAPFVKKVVYCLKRLKFSLRYVLCPLGDLFRRVCGYPSRIVLGENMQFLIDLTKSGR